MRSVLFLAFFVALAGRGWALNIVLGGSVGNISELDFLKPNDSKLIADCASNCTAGNQAIDACLDDNNCLCNSTTVTAITACEQCMLTSIIKENRKVSDPRAGSAVALNAYSAACAAPPLNITIPATSIALTLPADWDGPQSDILSTGVTVVAVIAGAVLGGGALVLLSSIQFPRNGSERRAAVQSPSRNLASLVDDLLVDASLHVPPPLPVEEGIAFETTGEQPECRYDWRLRAPSRTKSAPPRSERGWKRYPKRVEPSFEKLGPYTREIQAYKDQFVPLLLAEREEEESVLRERLSSWSVERLRAAGYCITGMRGFWMERHQFERPVATFQLGPGITLPEHKFAKGTQVLVSRLDPLKEAPVEGSIFSYTATQLQVSFPELFDIDQGEWRLDVGRSNMIYERMKAAIDNLQMDPALQEAYVSSPDREFVLQGTHLRDILLHSFSPALPEHHRTPVQDAQDPNYVPHEVLEHPSRIKGRHEGAFKDDMLIQSWARRYGRPNPVVMEGDPVLEGLNATQVRAVAMMIGERASLVHGPPGTGKTRTIIEAVRLLKVHFQVSIPLLVCTYTNVAVDNLVEGLVAAGVKPLRVGYSGKVEASLYEHTLEAKLEAHPLRPKLEKATADQEQLKKRLSYLHQQIEKLQAAKRSDLVRRLERMEMDAISLERQLVAVKSKCYALRQEMLHEVVYQADVICTTCITSASVALRVIDFPVIFLDEASMSTEPASLIPIMKGSRHVALIGDHKQLPPVITSREAQIRGLGISLFERLTEEAIVPSIMLDLQYRMHPAISRFPSSEFYNFCLQDGTVDASGNVPSHLHPPSSTHLLADPRTGHVPSVVFLDHGGAESFKDRSRVNWTEAHIVCSIIEDLLLSNEASGRARLMRPVTDLVQQGLRGEDIGVIAPYVAQISLLSRFLNTDANYQKHFKAVLGDQRAMQLANIEVKTVDGFEGREKDIIIFSTVRNNPKGYIGFLADRRRLNVGLTRAKRGLFVVGSLSTLRAGKTGGREGAVQKVGKGAEAWRRYVQFLTQENLVMSAGHGGSAARMERTATALG
ncbi:hypothetical protein EWM64_g2933 [Hericium alpestre]|uniref:AAA+ ATPase domain-containing protein n=1 Tax=Hericium alpestre TaxID=135208 RepID=A0A4Z0A3P8_9AGAM|nr:hypothetical protein EWM64_g2933 [Hericium alpestre]